MYYRLYIVLFSFCALKNRAKVKAQSWQQNADVENHLEMGRQLLAQGLYDDALTHYHAAVEGDPNNYLTFFKRATVYLAIGRIASALKDLTKVIELKPDFIAARLQRGSMFLKQGRLDEAHIDYENVLHVDPVNHEAQHGYTMIEPLKNDLRLAYVMFEDHNYHEAIDVLTRLLHELPWDSKLREMRSQCYEAIGDLVGAISDLRPILKSGSEIQERYLKISKLYYEIGETEEALNTIRECLRFDPDHKGCFTHYKKIKKINNHLKAMQEFISNGQYSECVDKANEVEPLETSVTFIMQYVKARLCFCLNKLDRPAEAIKACDDALRLNPNDAETLCERADAHLTNENYAEALHDYQTAANINENSRRAHDGIRKAQRLEKQSKKRNYYKILGVKKTAGKREILKAYRKLAQKWHPDNFQGTEKASAEKKFIDIAAAKEVLTDPEKRQKFDNGEDPLDPESQSGQNFNPFAQGFNPFDKGGPFTFRFHFS